MPTVDFYILTTTTWPDSSGFICRLVEKAYQQGHSLYVLTSSQDQSQWIYDALWTFRDISFVPHSFYEENGATPAPIQIGSTPQPNNHYDILLNLTTQVPSSHSEFERVLEIILEDKAVKSSGRAKYKAYQQAGYSLQSHTITQ